MALAPKCSYDVVWSRQENLELPMNVRFFAVLFSILLGQKAFGQEFFVTREDIGTWITGEILWTYEDGSFYVVDRNLPLAEGAESGVRLHQFGFDDSEALIVRQHLVGKYVLCGIILHLAGREYYSVDCFLAHPTMHEFGLFETCERSGGYSCLDGGSGLPTSLRRYGEVSLRCSDIDSENRGLFVRTHTASYTVGPPPSYAEQCEARDQ